MFKKYKVQIASSGKHDIALMKKYILQKFKYREIAENFSKKMKKILSSLDTFPSGHSSTEFSYKGYIIYLKPRNTYLVFYIIDENTLTVTILPVLQDWNGLETEFLYYFSEITRQRNSHVRCTEPTSSVSSEVCTLCMFGPIEMLSKPSIFFVKRPHSRPA